MHNSASLPPYDPEQALALASGKTDIRDRILVGALAFLAADSEVAPLLDVGSFVAAPSERSELAHRAITLMTQAGMPQLAQIFRNLTDALQAGRIGEAERLAGGLSEAIRQVHAAVAAQQTGGT
jgi:hypothetical protein